MTTMTIPNWDSSCMTAKLDGSHRLVGMQSATLGDGLETGSAVNQAGTLGPMGFMKPRFKGDGNFGIKILAAGWSDLQQYLLNDRGGSLYVEGVNGVKCNLTISLDRDGQLFEVSFKNVQFLTPTFSGIDAPDSREPLVAEVKFTCINRAINGVWDWNDSL